MQPNVDEAKDSRELLRKYEQLRTLIDHIPDMVYIKDTASRFVAANQAVAQQFNKASPEEIIGKTDLELTPHPLAEEYLADEKRLFETGLPITSKEEKGIDNKGNPKVSIVTKTPFKDESGSIAGLVGIGRNITDIANTRRDLLSKNLTIEKNRNELQVIIDSIPDVIYVKDTKSRFTNANIQMARLFNQSSADGLIGKTDFDFCDEELAREYFTDEQRIIETGKPMLSKVEEGRDADGKLIYLMVSKIPNTDENGNVNGIIGIGRNITEITLARHLLDEQSEALRAQNEEIKATLERLKQAQSQLVQSEKMASLGVLTAGIAHEINNPINFVYAGVNSMAKDFEDLKAVVEKMKVLPQAADANAAIADMENLRHRVGFDEAFEAVEETLKDIKLGATRITEIVAGLSKFSRLGQEEWQVSNLHEDIESVLVLLKNKYKTHIRIERDFEEQMLNIECFPSKLNQALMNILSNAIDAIDAHADSGTIVISTRSENGRAFISIADDGHGMDEKVRPKIFDPFFTTKGIGKGTGLGLAITYSIIQDHKGQLHISTEPNNGSTFVIELPIKQAET